MKLTYSKADLLKPSTAAILAGVINDVKHGGFMVVHGLRTKTGHGEVSDYTFQKGISYENAITNSLNILDKLENDPLYSIVVTRGIWCNSEGQESPTGRKSANYPFHRVITVPYSNNPHSEKYQALRQAFDKIRKSLTDPQPVTKEYTKLGNGIYEDENKTMFFRDLRLVRKLVIVHGQYPLSSKSEIVAIADAVEKTMPKGNYRQFRLDADFDSITMGGVELESENESPVIEVPQEKTQKTSDNVPVPVV